MYPDPIIRFQPHARVRLVLLADVLLVAGGLTLPGLPELAEAAPREPQSRRSGSSADVTAINPDGYTSSWVCGRCHEDIYNSWKNSLHAFSLTDPIFDAAYMKALKDGGEKAKHLCLRCHAPMTMANQDFDLEEGVTREGVSCDFCHTVVDVDLDNPQTPYVVSLGPVKRSVLRRAASPVHDVAFSELHGTAEFCAGCHNYTTPGGAAVMSTYDEWRSGPYAAEGKPCQSCHMVVGTGSVVSKQILKSESEMHLHDLIHDSDQLRGALVAEIVRADRSQDEVNVHVRVSNVRSGHKVPTGMPSREIVLTVAAESDGRVSSQERRYRKVIADENGTVRSEDWEALLYGVTVVSDNRIAPREERIERFQFYAREGRPVNVEVTLSYQYRPFIMQAKQIDVELCKVTETVR